MLKTVVMLTIFVETVMIESSFIWNRNLL